MVKSKNFSNIEKVRRDIYLCCRCGFCKEWDWKGVGVVCPVLPFTPEWETNYARGRVQVAKALVEKKLLPTDLNESFVKQTYQCTLCKNCVEHCPIGIPLVDLFEALRTDIAKMDKLLPAHKQISSNIQRFHNPYGPMPEHRKAKSLTSTKFPKKAQILYYPGCTPTYKTRAITDATIGILSKLHEDFTVLDEETCCGDLLCEIGQQTLYKKTAKRTLDIIKKREPEILLTTCPACYRSIKSNYPEKLDLSYDFEVQHITQFLIPLIKNGTIRLKESTEKIAYHDPCVLGRHMGIYDEPRAILKSIPKVKFVETAPNRKDSQCCGGGGGCLSAFDEISAKMSTARLEQIKKGCAETLVTACPACYVNFTRSSRYVKAAPAIKDISEVVNNLMECNSKT